MSFSKFFKHVGTTTLLSDRPAVSRSFSLRATRWVCPDDVDCRRLLRVASTCAHLNARDPRYILLHPRTLKVRHLRHRTLTRYRQTSSVNLMMQTLDWPSLQERRRRYMLFIYLYIFLSIYLSRYIYIYILRISS